MRSATLTILGLYEFDDGVFLEKHLLVPSTIDKGILIRNLVAELAELELLYPDLDTMAVLVDAWARKQLPIWNRLEQTMLYQYDPISNYDRTEEITEETVDDVSVQNTESKTDSGNTNNTGTHSVAAYNSNELLENERNSGNVGFSSQINGSGNSKTDANKKFTRSVRMYGNIGVTTTQEMIEEQRKIVKFNLYDYIIDEFKNRFCVLVY